MKAVHFREADALRTNRVGCGALPTPTMLISSDPRVTTCGRCPTTLRWRRAKEHADVIDANAYPKEDHPCLLP